MAIEQWTDLDYAQAAIDMLPGSVEEGIGFLRTEKIKNRKAGFRRSETCPITQWIKSWTDTDNVYTGWFNTYVDEEAISLPDNVRELVLELDRIQS